MSLKLEIDFVAKESHSGYPVKAEACCCSVETVMEAAQEDLPGKVGEGEEVYCKELVDQLGRMLADLAEDGAEAQFAEV